MRSILLIFSNIPNCIYIDSQRAYDLDRNLALQKLYYQPRGYYRTAKKLYEACREAGYNFTLYEVAKWLDRQTLH